MVELYSWWESRPEAEALQSVVDLHQTKYPGVTVVNEAVAVGGGRTELQRRMDAGQPPDLFQADIGQDLLQWVGTAPKIEKLNTVVVANGWAFYDDLLKPGNLSGPDGSVYGIPVDVHRINSLFVNLPVLQRNGIDPKSLTTLSGFHAALQTLSNDPQLVAPITIGSRNQWTLDILILETLLPAIAGGQFYEDYFRGLASPDDPLVTATLNEAVRLWQYMPTGSEAPNELDWLQGIDELIAGHVAMEVMGDWAKGYIDDDGTLTPGVGYDEIPFPSAPGVPGTFVYLSDAFTLPVGAPSRELAIGFLQTFCSDDGQVAFSAIKGSIPPRPLPATATAQLDAVARRTIVDFETAPDRRVALAAFMPDEFRDSVYAALFDFAATCEAGACDPSLVADALAANYALLEH